MHRNNRRRCRHGRGHFCVSCRRPCPRAFLFILTPADLPNGTVATPYTTTLTASGVFPLVWTLAPGSALPAGLALDPFTGVISGVPFVAGTFSFAIYVTDRCMQVSQKLFTLTILPIGTPLIITTPTVLPDATVGTAYTVTFMASGGQTPYTWSLGAGSTLPPGLSLSSAGVLSGTPTSAVGSPFSFVIQVADSSTPSQVTSKTFTLTVTNATTPLVITTPPTLPGATVGTPYTTTLMATGGQTPYVWSLVAGSTLPPGLVLSSAGVISGTPTDATGSPFSFTIQVADSSTPSQMTSQTFTLAVSTMLVITTTTLPEANINEDYNATIMTTGGTSPLTFSIISGSLPAGLVLNAATGVISGAPTLSAMNGTFVIQVTDSSSPPQTPTQNLSIEVTMSVGPGVVPGAIVGEPYSYQLQVMGGMAPYTFVGSAPNGLTLSSTGLVSGTPTDPAGEFAIEYNVTDSGTPMQSVPGASLIAISDPLVITTTTLPDATIGVPYDQFVTTTGGTAPLTFSLLTGTLPDGLNLDPDTGEITGTPALDAVTSSFTVQVVDSGSPQQMATQPLTINVS